MRPQIALFPLTPPKALFTLMPPVHHYGVMRRRFAQFSLALFTDKDSDATGEDSDAEFFTGKDPAANRPVHSSPRPRPRDHACPPCFA